MSGAPRDAYEMLLDHAASANIPISALVELTNACNVDCEHCYLDLVADKKLGALSTEEWRRVFRELADEGTLFLTMSGGELLVRRDWFELASYARELDFALRIFTNGTLIDELNADRIASLDPIGVEISILGATAATHDAITRRRGSFDKTIRGVRLLRARGMSLLLKCVVMKKNVAEQEAIEKLAEDLGCASFFDLQISPKNDGSLAPPELSPELDALREAAKRIFAKQGSCTQEAQFDRETRLKAMPCSAGRRTCHIAPTGDVYPCVQWTKSAGNVREKTFGEVWWGSEELKEVRAKRIGSFETCRTCELLEVCTPCMALSQLERGVVDGPSPTKCRNTLVRAQALGLPGFPAGLARSEEDRPSGVVAIDEAPSGLVQLRVRSRAQTA